MKNLTRSVNNIIEKIDSAFVSSLFYNNVSCYRELLNFDEGKIMEILNHINELLQNENIYFITESITENEAFFRAYNDIYEPIGFALIVNKEYHEVIYLDNQLHVK